MQIDNKELLKLLLKYLYNKVDENPVKKILRKRKRVVKPEPKVNDYDRLDKLIFTSAATPSYFNRRELINMG